MILLLLHNTPTVLTSPSNEAQALEQNIQFKHSQLGGYNHLIALDLLSLPSIILCGLLSAKAKRRGSKKDAVSDEERRRLSTMTEEDEDHSGITIKVGGDGDSHESQV